MFNLLQAFQSIWKSYLESFHAIFSPFICNTEQKITPASLKSYSLLWWKPVCISIWLLWFRFVRQEGTSRQRDRVKLCSQWVWLKAILTVTTCCSSCCCSARVHLHQMTEEMTVAHVSSHVTATAFDTTYFHFTCESCATWGQLGTTFFHCFWHTWKED